MGERVLVLGGTRSGKSAEAERLAAAHPSVVYVATGAADDAEMAERVAAHRERRPAAWATVETADVGKALGAAPPGACVLVDDLTGWLADRFGAHGLWPSSEDELAPLGAAGEAAVARVVDEAAALWSEAAARPGPVIVVADESGLGPVPAHPAARRWLDVMGAVVQRLAGDADRVVLVVAGRPLDLPRPTPGRGAGPPGNWRTGAAPAHPGLRVHGDAQLREAGTVVDFAVNVHDGPQSARVREALRTSAGDARAYPDERAATRAVAALHGRPEDEVLLTAGAAEAFWLLAQAVRARRAVCVHPSFTEPEAALRAHGVPVAHVLRDRGDGWALRPERVPGDADLVVLGNPNNPTGTLDPAAAVAALCRPGRVTLVDEAFMGFTPREAESLAGRRDLPGLVVTRSVTKLWGVAGVRAGYLLGPAGLVARCAALRQPWSVSTQALAVLEACADDEGHRRAVADRVARDREAMAAELAALGLRTWPSAGNFLLAEVPGAAAVARGLRERGIAVRTPTFPGLGPDHLRLAVRGQQARGLLVAALRELIDTKAAP